MDSRPDDEVLLLAVAERDLGAVRTLYERHAGWLAIRLTRRCNDRDLVADAIQDTFVAVWQKPQGRSCAGRQRTARIRRGVRGPNADRRTGRGGPRRRGAGADGAQPRAAGRALGPHVPGTRRQRAVLGITCSGSSSRCAWWPSLSRSAAEVCPGGCPVFRDSGDDGLEASRTPPCGQPHPPRRPTPFCLGRPVRSVDGTYPD